MLECLSSSFCDEALRRRPLRIGIVSLELSTGSHPRRDCLEAINTAINSYTVTGNGELSLPAHEVPTAYSEG